MSSILDFMESFFIVTFNEYCKHLKKTKTMRSPQQYYLDHLMNKNNSLVTLT